MGKRQKKVNWKSYNKELVKRGSISLWVDQKALDHWFSHQSGPGFQKIYSDLTIELLLILRHRFSLTLRETQGFASSLLELMGLFLPVPNYSTLSRRANSLEVQIRKKSSTKRSIHAVIDSTGLKVFGEGEWKVRQHGYSKRRTWRKLHLCIDEETNEIMSSVLTENSFKDNEVFEDLIDAAEADIYQASGDGAYDARNCWEYCDKRNIQGVFPPRVNAKIQVHGNSKAPPGSRDQHLRQIRELGKPIWKAMSGYSRRSLSETAMYRFKALFGDKLSSRNFNNQSTEAFIKCKILNLMQTPANL